MKLTAAVMRKWTKINTRDSRKTICRKMNTRNHGIQYGSWKKGSSIFTLEPITLVKALP